MYYSRVWARTLKYRCLSETAKGDPSLAPPLRFHTKRSDLEKWRVPETRSSTRSYGRLSRNALSLSLVLQTPVHPLSKPFRGISNVQFPPREFATRKGAAPQPTRPGPRATPRLSPLSLKKSGGERLSGDIWRVVLESHRTKCESRSNSNAVSESSRCLETRYERERFR